MGGAERVEADVAIVGGGISGLVAARRLVAAGLDVVLLDARDEPGGKCLVRDAGGRAVDAGAGWTAAGQRHVKELAAEYGIETYSFDVPGGKVAKLYRGSVEYYEPGELGVPPECAAEFERALAELDRLAGLVPAARPWEAHDAVELDALTPDAWIRSQSGDERVRYALAETFASTCAPLRQVSMLAVLAFINSCGGLESLETEADELFVGGAGQLPARIAEDLGARVRLGWRVREIERSENGVELRGPRGVVTARRAIIAMNPAAARHIEHSPPLPTTRAHLEMGWLAASLIKTQIVYERPFWHEPRGDRPAIAGWITSDLNCPTIVLDTTPADKAYGCFAAFTFLEPEHERFGYDEAVLDDAEARRRVVLENMERLFGPEAARPTAMLEVHWPQEPHVAGCLTWAPPGLLTLAGHALREPVGPIHWAGTETAEVWINHLSGGIQAAERAAAEVVAALVPAGV